MNDSEDDIRIIANLVIGEGASVIAAWDRIKTIVRDQQLIHHIRSGILNKLSVGFKFEPKDYLCDICGKSVISIECPHMPKTKLLSLAGLDKSNKGYTTIPQSNELRKAQDWNDIADAANSVKLAGEHVQRLMNAAEAENQDAMHVLALRGAASQLKEIASGLHCLRDDMTK